MKSFSFLLTGILVLTIGVGFCGCKPPAEDGENHEEHSDAEHADGHDHEHGEDGHSAHDDEGKGGDAEAKVAEGLAMLSAEDKALAEKQKICPVSDMPLGAKGKPIKLTVKDDQTIFVCCKGCEAPVKGDPDKFLAKLAEK